MVNKIILTTLLIFTTITSNAQARIEIKDAKKNFGFVNKGDLVRINYEITNAGNEPLILNKVEFTCSCTTAEFEKNPILPGKSTVVTLLFDTKPTYDRQDRTALLYSNDPKSPQKLRYKGVVLNK